MNEHCNTTDYDSLLTFFAGKDELRPWMLSPTKVGEKIYSTDSYSLLTVPANRVNKVYKEHNGTPNYKDVLDQLKKVGPLIFKGTDLFNILKQCPKENDTIFCKDCEGDGTCPHCGSTCQSCDGQGELEDPTLPKVYSVEKVGIKIDRQIFSPRELAKVERVLVESFSDYFEIIGRNTSAILIKLQIWKLWFPSYIGTKILSEKKKFLF